MDITRQISNLDAANAKLAPLGNGSVLLEQNGFAERQAKAFSLSNAAQMQAFSNKVVEYAPEVSRFEATRLGIYSLESLQGIKEQVNYGVEGEGDGSSNESLAYIRDSSLQKLSVTIETQEGDRLTINITADRGAVSVEGDTSKTSASRLFYSFDVSGDLNESEMIAIGELLPSVMSDTASFFAQPNGLLSLDSIKKIDKYQISGLDIDLVAERNQFHAKYEFDDINQKHRLNVNQNGYRYNVSVSNDALYLTGDIENNADIKQYQEILAATTREHFGAAYAQQDIFFTAGLVSLMEVASQRPETDQEKLEDDKDNDHTQRAAFNRLLPNAQVAVKRLFSGLPDFDAEFHSPITKPNQNNVMELNLFSVELSQKTKVSSRGSGIGEITRIEQKSTIDIDSRKHSALPNRLRVDFKNGDYVYEIKKLHYEALRELDILESDKPIAASFSQFTEGDYDRKEVKNGEVVARKSMHTEHRTTQDMLALVSEKQSPNDVVETLIKRQMVDEVLKQYGKLR